MSLKIKASNSFFWQCDLNHFIASQLGGPHGPTPVLLIQTFRAIPKYKLKEDEFEEFLCAIKNTILLVVAMYSWQKTFVGSVSFSTCQMDLHLERLIFHKCIKQTAMRHKARWHKICRLKFNKRTHDV